MTTAQRRTVHVKIQTGDHIVEITADVVDPEEVQQLAEATHRRTRPEPYPRFAAGFGQAYAERTPDRPVAGDPSYPYSPVTAQKENPCLPPSR